MADSQTHQEENPKVAFEPTDWPIAPVALVYLGTLILLVVSALGVMVGYSKTFPDVGRTLRIAPPGPRLQTNAERDLLRFRAEEERNLNTYYWIDKEKGAVHIPIEQAMQNLVKSGSSGFPKEQQ